MGMKQFNRLNSNKISDTGNQTNPNTKSIITRKVSDRLHLHWHSKDASSAHAEPIVCSRWQSGDRWTLVQRLQNPTRPTRTLAATWNTGLTLALCPQSTCPAQIFVKQT